MSTRFRITTWPDEPVPRPVVDVPDTVLRAGEWLVFQSTDWRGTYRELPAEIYLRDAKDLDVSDLDAIASFVRQHGRIAPSVDLDRDLPGGSGVEIMRQAARAGRRYERTVDDVRGGALRVHVDEVVYRLRVLRVLTDHALAYVRGDYEHEAWPDHAEWPAGLDRDAMAWQHFTNYANAALREFHVRVWADAGDPDFNIGAPRPAVYEAAVLQLVNDLIEEVDYRPCAHCGRIFARQVGRSTQRSRRQGVMYCSPECGRAAAVKAYRERKRKERNGRDRGQHRQEV